MIAFRSIFGFLLILLPCLLSLLPPPLHAAEFSPGLRAVMQSAPPAEPIPVIVTLDKPAEVVALARKHGKKHRTTLVRELKERARRAQAPVTSFLEGQGITEFKDLWLINGLAFEASAQVVEALQFLPGVEAVVLNETVHLEPVPLQSHPSPGWNIPRVRAPDLWALGHDGTGVVVAVLDSGVDLGHPELAERWRGTIDPTSVSWFDPYGQFTTPDDTLDSSFGVGHGTAVTGVILAGEADANTIIPGVATGVAPGAQWIAARIFDSQGNSTNDVIVRALQWALDPDGIPATDDAADIVNNSWGLNALNQCVEVYRTAIQTLKTSGIAVVAAAGNSGPAASSSESPANYPEVVAVGSTDDLNIVSSFSARGPSACDGAVYPDVVAPGEFITTTDITLVSFRPEYSTVSGTSFATPHIAGVMALLMQAFPAATVAQIEEAIRLSATDLGEAGPDNSYGNGLVDALAAFDFLSGDPDIEVHDSAAPNNDLLVDFGSIGPGTSLSHTITLRNAGSGQLTIIEVDASAVIAPFALRGSCDNAQLLSNETCSLTVTFAPSGFGSFSGNLAVTSNDPDESVVTISLVGIGNTLPPVAQLLEPDPGESVLGPDVLFAWTQGPDADGDPITNRLVLSPHSDLSNPRVFPVDPVVVVPALAGILGFVLIGVRRRFLGGLIFALALALLLSCSGGGGSDGIFIVDEPLPDNATIFTATNLVSGVTYFWKVETEDVRGGVTETDVRSFTVR